VLEQHGPPLTLGHPTPDAELGPVVEGVGQAFAMTGHFWQTTLACCWAAPRTNRASGSMLTHRPLLAQCCGWAPVAGYPVARPVVPSARWMVMLISASRFCCFDLEDRGGRSLLKPPSRLTC